MELINFIADSLYQGVLGTYWLIQALPFPTWPEVFKSMAVFVCLYPVRLIMKVLLPEDTVARRVAKRRKALAPSAAEHQGASAIASEFFNH